MKRLLAIILALLLTLGLFAGCGSDEPDPLQPGNNPTAEQPPEPKPDKAGEVGYWVLKRVESEDPSRVMSEEDVKSLGEFGLEIFIDLKEDGTGGIMMDEYAALKWANGKFDLGTDEFNISYSLKGEEFYMDFDGDTYVFIRGEGEAPKVEPPAQTDEPEEDELDSWWAGDWYGWWIVDSSYGDYADWEGRFWDCCAEIDVYEDGTGFINFWDQDGARNDNIMGCEVYFGAGVSEAGTMWAEEGYFWDAEIGHADWYADPGAMGFEIDDMMLIDYRYEDPNDPDSWLDAYIFLRPWGRDWDDLDGVYEDDWPYDDMMPLYYSDWYKPLIEKGLPMPKSFDEGLELLGGSPAGSGDVLAEGFWEDCVIKVVGAEHFVDSDDKDAIRVYYEFTNTSDESTTPVNIISFDVTQDEYTQNPAYAYFDDDVEEYGNDYLHVRPGITIRCVAEYSMKLTGGKLSMKFYDFWNEEDSFTVEFDPQDLPGRPPKWEQEQIINPAWLAGATMEGDLEDFRAALDYVEVIEDENGGYGLRIYLIYTNLGDEPCSFNWAAYYHAYQDGVELETAWPTYEYVCDEDDMIYEEIQPGESILVSSCYKLRNEQSPVEFEITDGWTDAVVGAVYELTWGG